MICPECDTEVKNWKGLRAHVRSKHGKKADTFLTFGYDVGKEENTEGLEGNLKNLEEEYDLIILDPPAFAKHHNVLHNALQGYKKLNRKAIQKINKGGVLFTFSCSQVVSRENFRKMIL